MNAIWSVQRSSVSHLQICVLNLLSRFLQFWGEITLLKCAVFCGQSFLPPTRDRHGSSKRSSADVYALEIKTSEIQCHWGNAFQKAPSLSHHRPTTMGMVFPAERWHIGNWTVAPWSNIFRFWGKGDQQTTKVTKQSLRKSCDTSFSFSSKVTKLVRSYSSTHFNRETTVWQKIISSPERRHAQCDQELEKLVVLRPKSRQHEWLLSRCRRRRNDCVRFSFLYFAPFPDHTCSAHFNPPTLCRKLHPLRTLAESDDRHVPASNDKRQSAALFISRFLALCCMYWLFHKGKMHLRLRKPCTSTWLTHQD